MAEESAVECPQCGYTNEPVERRCSSCQVDLDWALERGSQHWTEDVATRPPLILLSEDDFALLTGIGELLESEGYRVAMTPDPSVTIELVERLQPDLIITDFRKPIMNGAEMLSRIRANPAFRDIPVIMATGGNEYWKVSSAMEVDVTCWLQKPFSIGELSAIIASVLSGDLLPLVFFVHGKKTSKLPAHLVENYRILIPTPHEETIRWARLMNPDLIAVGAPLSGGSGLDILTELKADNTTRNIPVVMWGDDPDPELEQQAMQCGAQAVYTGPPDGAALARVLRSVLGEI